MSTTTNIEFLQSNLLDDAAASVWGTAELYDTMEVHTYPFSETFARVGATATYFESGKTFLLEAGTVQGQAPDLQLFRAGSLMGTDEFTMDCLNGRITLATISTSLGELFTGTYYACNLYGVAEMCLLRRMNSTAMTGEKKSIRLGDLAKSVTGPREMVESFNGRINAFRAYARRWREIATNPPRVRK